MQILNMFTKNDTTLNQDNANEYFYYNRTFGRTEKDGSITVVDRFAHLKDGDHVFVINCTKTSTNRWVKCCIFRSQEFQFNEIIDENVRMKIPQEFHKNKFSRLEVYKHIPILNHLNFNSGHTITCWIMRDNFENDADFTKSIQNKIHQSELLIKLFHNDQIIQGFLTEVISILRAYSPAEMNVSKSDESDESDESDQKEKFEGKENIDAAKDVHGERLYRSENYNNDENIENYRFESLGKSLARLLYKISEGKYITNLTQDQNEIEYELTDDTNIIEFSLKCEIPNSLDVNLEEKELTKIKTTPSEIAWLAYFFVYHNRKDGSDYIQTQPSQANLERGTTDWATSRYFNAYYTFFRKIKNQNEKLPAIKKGDFSFLVKRFYFQIITNFGFDVYNFIFAREEDIPFIRIYYESEIKRLCAKNKKPPRALSNLNLKLEFVFQIVRKSLDYAKQRGSGQPNRLLLYGPPGTGKTRAAENTWIPALVWGYPEASPKNSLKRQDLGKCQWDWRVKTVQFHPSYGYDNFIEGIKPITVNGQIRYAVIPGLFKALAVVCATDSYARIVAYRGNQDKIYLNKDLMKSYWLDQYCCQDQAEYNEGKIKLLVQKKEGKETEMLTAYLSPHSGQIEFLPGAFSPNEEVFELEIRRPEWGQGRFALFIDEFSRGQVIKIFGECLSLFSEDSPRADTRPDIITEVSKEKLVLPVNLDIVCAMNTADRSIDEIDQAVRRRFRLVEMSPNPEVFRMNDVWKFFSPDPINATSDFSFGNPQCPSTLMITLNDNLKNMFPNNSEHRIGHSYFLRALRGTENLRDKDKRQMVFSQFKQEIFHGIFPAVQAMCHYDAKKVAPVFLGRPLPPDINVPGWGRVLSDIANYKPEDGLSLEPNKVAEDTENILKSIRGFAA
jgi:hypothetical protein